MTVIRRRNWRVETSKRIRPERRAMIRRLKRMSPAALDRWCTWRRTIDIEGPTSVTRERVDTQGEDVGAATADSLQNERQSHEV